MDNLISGNIIYETIAQLKKARKSLENLRSKFQDQPNVLGFYEPSAVFVVDRLENQLSNLLSQETGVNFKPSSETDNSADLWIRIEGEDFEGGKGPIGQVGNFLTKLNNANRNVISLIEHKKGIKKKNSDIPSFNLVATAAGSLKLGLKKPDINIEIEEQSNQMELFSPEEQDPWDKFKNAIEDSRAATQSMKVLVKAIASVHNENALTELMADFEDKEVIKIIHYAKELAPSNRSSIDFVSIEGNDIGVSEKIIRTDKTTRKILTEHAKKLLPSTEYIEGTAVIGVADVHNKMLIARPLKYNNIVHDEIRCLFLKPVTPEEIKEFLNEMVTISGYIIYDKSGRLLRLEIDEIEIKVKDE
ncbi:MULTISPECIES: hypothetical protein [Paenibacillus]|uniref:hypothetical protein n=1 Tax=Paenibacillus TaxID=44249 RepID=UPI0022B8F7CC|nr:hypothetical protein [Paenibacillus caseinilyticus]MCZ8520166.1 hypothetical protein [Paenibacillus caseinilyticus]